MTYTHSVTVVAKFTYPIVEDNPLTISEIKDGVIKYSLATEEAILELARGANIEIVDVQVNTIKIT